MISIGYKIQGAHFLHESATYTHPEMRIQKGFYNIVVRFARRDVFLLISFR